MTRDEYAITADKHRTKMVNRAALYVGDRDTAIDMVSQAIEKGLRHCTRVTRAGYEKYMFHAVRNACLNFMELSRHNEEIPFCVDDEGAPLQDEKVWPQHDLRMDLFMALRALPVRLQGVAIAIYCEELTEKEVSVSLGCSQQTISNRVSEINGLLRITLAAYRTGRATCETKLTVNQ